MPAKTHRYAARVARRQRTRAERLYQLASNTPVIVGLIVFAVGPATTLWVRLLIALGAAAATVVITVPAYFYWRRRHRPHIDTSSPDARQ
jgi:hypothetical protein